MAPERHAGGTGTGNKEQSGLRGLSLPRHRVGNPPGGHQCVGCSPPKRTVQSRSLGAHTLPLLESSTLIRTAPMTVQHRGSREQQKGSRTPAELRETTTPIVPIVRSKSDSSDPHLSHIPLTPSFQLFSPRSVSSPLARPPLLAQNRARSMYLVVLFCAFVILPVPPNGEAEYNVPPTCG